MPYFGVKLGCAVKIPYGGSSMMTSVYQNVLEIPVKIAVLKPISMFTPLQVNFISKFWINCQPKVDSKHCQWNHWQSIKSKKYGMAKKMLRHGKSLNRGKTIIFPWEFLITTEVQCLSPNLITAKTEELKLVSKNLYLLINLWYLQAQHIGKDSYISVNFFIVIYWIESFEYKI